MTFTLPGYHITDQISESSSSRVYRGYRETDHLPMIFKLLNQDYPTPAELARYQREYDLLRSLDLEGVVKTCGLEKYGNSPVLLLEDFGGQSLRRVVQTRRFTLVEVLRLAIRLADILGQVHTAHIIHKDVNPCNIVLGPLNGEATGLAGPPPRGGVRLVVPPPGDRGESGGGYSYNQTGRLWPGHPGIAGDAPGEEPQCAGRDVGLHLP